MLILPSLGYALGLEYTDQIESLANNNEDDFLSLDGANNDDIETILGTWQLDKRRCLSGAPVLDGFKPQRDFAFIKYMENKFQYDSYVNGCHLTSKGSYELNTPFVIYKNIRSNSTCGGISFKTREQNPYRLNGTTLVFYFGPFIQGPAPCPMGDTLEVEYKRTTDSL